MNPAVRPRLGILLGIPLIVLSACSDDPPPAGDAATPTPAPGTSRISLDEYVSAMCAGPEEGEIPDITYRQNSAELGQAIELSQAVEQFGR